MRKYKNNKGLRIRPLTKGKLLGSRGQPMGTKKEVDRRESAEKENTSEIFNKGQQETGNKDLVTNNPLIEYESQLPEKEISSVPEIEDKESDISPIDEFEIFKMEHAEISENVVDKSTEEESGVNPKRETLVEELNSVSQETNSGIIKGLTAISEENLISPDTVRQKSIIKEENSNGQPPVSTSVLKDEKVVNIEQRNKGKSDHLQAEINRYISIKRRNSILKKTAGSEVTRKSRKQRTSGHVRNAPVFRSFVISTIRRLLDEEKFLFAEEEIKKLILSSESTDRHRKRLRRFKNDGLQKDKYATLDRLRNDGSKRQQWTRASHVKSLKKGPLKKESDMNRERLALMEALLNAKMINSNKNIRW